MASDPPRGHREFAKGWHERRLLQPWARARARDNGRRNQDRHQATDRGRPAERPGMRAMSARREGGGDDRINSAISALPASYRRWRTSRLGRITDKLERALILELCGDVAGLQVLDLGCGDGDLAVALGRAGTKVTGLDADQRMLRAARKRQTPDAPSINFVRGDVTALPFADRIFDVVTAITVLCFVPDARTAMAEMARVLKPGGRLVVGELGRYSAWTALRRIRGWLGSATWRAARFRSARDMRGLVEQAGLSVATVRGAVFYPPLGWLAAMMARVDPWLGRRATLGAGFMALAATAEGKVVDQPQCRCCGAR